MSLLETTIGDCWVAEYSDKQGCFNVDSLRRALEANVTLVQKKENTGYLIFGLFKKMDEAEAACDEMRKRQSK
ncbi:MAG: hypothetical protein ACYS1A_18475 [Planctomycetota bacterium]|jgi:hypothetical protein